MRVLLFILSFNLFASGNLSTFDHNHTKWDTLLRLYVKMEKPSSLFNYKAIADKPAALDSYLKDLEKVSSQDFSKFNNSQKLSFWINAYNAYTVKLVANHYPVASIKDIKTEKKQSGFMSFFKKINPISNPWKINFIKLLGKTISLDHIEHGIIRKEFPEPRIHFAVNCASAGCPSLLNQAFTADKLEAQLAKVSLSFVNNNAKNIFDKNNKVFKASPIFKWYGSDFNKKFGSFVGFVKSIKPELKDLETYKIDWTNYGWNLNGI